MVYSEIITLYSNTADKLHLPENGIVLALCDIVVLLTVVSVLSVLLTAFLLFSVVAPKEYEHHQQEDQPVVEPEHHGEGDDLEARLPDGKIGSLPFLGLRQGGGRGEGRNPRQGRDQILQLGVVEP